MNIRRSLNCVIRHQLSFVADFFNLASNSVKRSQFHNTQLCINIRPLNARHTHMKHAWTGLKQSKQCKYKLKISMSMSVEVLVYSMGRRLSHRQWSHSCEAAHPVYVSRRRSDPIKLQHKTHIGRTAGSDLTGMSANTSAVVVTGSTATLNSTFLPSGGRNRRQYAWLCNVYILKFRTRILIESYFPQKSKRNERRGMI